MQHQIDDLVKKLQSLPIAHLIFLLTFDPPRTTNNYPKLPPMLPYTGWDEFLKGNPLQVTEDLLSMDALICSNLQTHLEYFFTKDHLQAMLGERGLALSGNKSDLVERLVRADEQTMWAKVGNCILLECTPWAWQTAKTCLEGVIENNIETVPDQRSSKENIKNAIQWILAAAAGGIIGNRVDTALVTLIEKIRQQMALGYSETTYNPESPLPTPIPQQLVYNLPSSELTTATDFYASPNRSESLVPAFRLPAGEKVYVMGRNKSGSHLRVVWEGAIGWVGVPFTDYNDRRDVRSVRIRYHPFTDYNDRRDRLESLPILRDMPAKAAPIITLFGFNSTYTISSKGRFIVIADLFRSQLGNFPPSSLVLTVNGKEIERSRRSIIEQGQFLLMDALFTLASNEIEAGDTVSFGLYTSYDKPLRFMATIYQIHQSWWEYPGRTTTSPWGPNFGNYIFGNYGDFTVKHLREVPGGQLTEFLSFEDHPVLDNSNGTKSLSVQFELQRLYRHIIRLELSSQKVSTTIVKNLMTDLYGLPSDNPEITIKQALGVISVVVPAGKRTKITVQWTELWSEGVIDEGKDGTGNRLGTYAVFLGYVQPCNLIYQENIS